MWQAPRPQVNSASPTFTQPPAPMVGRCKKVGYYRLLHHWVPSLVPPLYELESKLLVIDHPSKEGILGTDRLDGGYDIEVEAVNLQRYSFGDGGMSQLDY
jgi:hypothetical protein